VSSVARSTLYGRPGAGLSGRTGAPAIPRPRLTNLAEALHAQQLAIRDRKHVPVGYVLRIQLGPDDDAAYFQDPVNAQIAPITRMQGLSFEWDQTCYPHMTEMNGRGSGVFLFPDGVRALPKISDPRSRKLSPFDPDPPKIRQDLEYFRSGIVVGRDGMTYHVLQPVLQIAVRIPTSMVILDGQMPGPDGRHAALLFSEKKRHGVHWAFLVHGNLRFL
jgi:hypothetical protein